MISNTKGTKGYLPPVAFLVKEVDGEDSYLLAHPGDNLAAIDDHAIVGEYHLVSLSRKTTTHGLTETQRVK